MLDPRYKNLYLVSPFINLEQGKTIFEKYDRKTLYILKCYNHLHPLSKNAIID